jgi:hypothetical protein
MIFVTTTKKFNNIFRNIQKNSLRSWNRLNIDKKIIVLTGDSETIEFCKESGFMFEETFEKSPRTGIPTFRSLYNIGKHYAKDDEEICVLNADIILDDDFVNTLMSFRESFSSQKKYLLVGQRIDANFNNALIDFSNESWRESMTDANMHPGCGIDYFLMSKYTFENLPDFYMSRLNYDGWLLGEANSNTETLVVDCTKTIKAFHQNHLYGENGDIVDADWVKHSTIIADVKENQRYPHRLSIESVPIKSFKLADRIIFN